MTVSQQLYDHMRVRWWRRGQTWGSWLTHGDVMKGDWAAMVLHVLNCQNTLQLENKPLVKGEFHHLLTLIANL